MRIQSGTAEDLDAPPAREIRMFAVRRSGHHALIHWIAQQCGEPIRFINDCQPFENPLQYHGRQPRAAEEWYIGIKDPRFLALSGSPLVYNYEHRDLAPFASREVVPAGLRFGTGEQVREVLVHRDPYNLLASHRKWRPEEFDRPEYVPRLLALWKLYAREFLRTTEYLADPVCVNYNRWFIDPGYRTGLIRALDLPVAADLGVPAEVSPYGGGSSFDKSTMDGQAAQMKVLERWKAFDGRQPLTELIDAETQELSDQIFGPILDQPLTPAA